MSGMTHLHHNVSAHIQPSEATSPSTMIVDDTNPGEVKENDAPELASDKKTDEIIEPKPQVGLLWRLSSGVVNTTTGAVSGAVGMGVGGVKWVAGTGYNAGATVISTTVNTTKAVAKKVPSWKTKPKKE